METFSTSKNMVLSKPSYSGYLLILFTIDKSGFAEEKK